MSTTTYQLRAVGPRSAPRLAEPLAKLAFGAYAFVAALLASVLRPQAESPEESAMRLRRYADRYSSTMPGVAADLRAAADRHQMMGEAGN